MSEAKTHILRKRFTPVAVGSDETTAIFNVKKGWLVDAAGYRVDTAAAASTAITITLGDDTDPDGYIAAFDPETATAAAGAGAYLAASGGKLYAADDTIDVVYDQTTPGATPPVVMFWIKYTAVFQ